MIFLDFGGYENKLHQYENRKQIFKIRMPGSFYAGRQWQMSEQIELFSEKQKPTNVPLAEQVRPANLTGIKGQGKLLESGSLLRTMIEQDSYSSFILWGPPGTGKTTLARLIQKQTKSRFV